MLMAATMETYALTTTTYQRRSLFVRTENAELLVTTLFHYRDQGRYQLHGFVVMPEHLHVLLTPLPNQPGFHEHRIRDEEDFRRQLGYIAANPDKRGLVDWAFVHMRFSERIDPIPSRFER